MCITSSEALATAPVRDPNGMTTAVRIRLMRLQVPETLFRENRESGENPLRTQRCNGDRPDNRHWLTPGRRPDGMNLSQKTGLKSH